MSTLIWAFLSFKTRKNGLELLTNDILDVIVLPADINEGGAAVKLLGAEVGLLLMDVHEFFHPETSPWDTPGFGLNSCPAPPAEF